MRVWIPFFQALFALSAISVLPGCSGTTYPELPADAAARIVVHTPEDWQRFEAEDTVIVRYEFFPVASGDIVHLYLDNRLVRILRRPEGSYSLGSLAEGSHLLRLSLRDAQHRSRNETVSFAITVGPVREVTSSSSVAPAVEPLKQPQQQSSITSGSQQSRPAQSAAVSKTAVSESRAASSIKTAKLQPTAEQRRKQGNKADPSTIRIIAPTKNVTIAPGKPWKLQYAFVPLLPGDHLHVLIDDQLKMMIREPSGSVELPPLSVGVHTLRLELNDATHQPVGIEAKRQIQAGELPVTSNEPKRRTAFQQTIGGTVAVEKRQPLKDRSASPTLLQQISLLEPKDRQQFASGNPVVLQYRFAPLLEGDHLHLYVNNVLKTMLREPSGSFSLEKLPVGEHRIRLELNDRTHQPVGIEQSIAITVLE